jgi:hypothetical protein
MSTLQQQIGLDKIKAGRVLDEILNQISEGLHGYDDNGPVRVSIPRFSQPQRNNKGKLIPNPGIATLRALRQHKIIVYEKALGRVTGDPISKSPSSIYKVFVTNRYLFEQLVVERNHKIFSTILKLRHKLDVPNLIYYNSSRGDITVNGIHGRLKRGSLYKNREIFNLLLRCAPEPAPRGEILKILKMTSPTKYSDTDRTYKINNAVDNLRDALGVKSKVLSLKHADGLHLNATVIKVEKLPKDFRFTD